MTRTPLTPAGHGRCYDCDERRALFQHSRLTVAGTCKPCIEERERAEAGMPCQGRHSFERGGRANGEGRRSRRRQRTKPRPKRRAA